MVGVPRAIGSKDLCRPASGGRGFISRAVVGIGDLGVGDLAVSSG